MMNINLNLGFSHQGDPLMWNGEPNLHLCVSGISGTGKSNLIKYLATQLPGQGVNAVVLDYPGDYREFFDLYTAKKEIPYVPYDIQTVGADPFCSYRDGDINPESSFMTAARIAEAVTSAYHLKGPTQQMNLRRVLREYLDGESGDLSLADLLTWNMQCPEAKQLSQTVLMRLEEINEVLPPRKSFRWDLENPGITLVSFDSLPSASSVQTMAVEFLLEELMSLKTGPASGKLCPVVVILDEIQRMSWSPDSACVRILREGRKYGLFLWGASQWIDDENALNALGQASLCAYFKPGDRNVNALAKILCDDTWSMDKYKKLIRNLRTGQFIYLDKADEKTRPIVCCTPNISDSI